MQKTADNYSNVGTAFWHALNNCPQWKWIRAKDDQITPYSLRHSYAWRAQMDFQTQLPERILAQLMGHTVETFRKHYGRWTDTDALESAVEALMKGV